SSYLCSVAPVTSQGTSRPFNDLQCRDRGLVQRDLWNVAPRPPGQSALIPINLITLPHFSVSSTMSLPKSADVIDIGSTPKPASRAFMMGSAAMALISLFSLSITSAGVSFGAATPYHWFAS